MKREEKALLAVAAIVTGYLVLKELAPPPPVGKATLSVDTAPVKGAIYLNGVYQGIAPMTFEVDPGTYTVGFGDVEGYMTPQPYYAVLHEGDIVAVTGTYEPMPPEEVYVCPVCLEGFATFSDVFSHLVSQHPDWWLSQ